MATWNNCPSVNQKQRKKQEICFCFVRTERGNLLWTRGKQSKLAKLLSCLFECDYRLESILDVRKRRKRKNDWKPVLLLTSPSCCCCMKFIVTSLNCFLVFMFGGLIDFWTFKITNTYVFSINLFKNNHTSQCKIRFWMHFVLEFQV